MIDDLEALVKYLMLHFIVPSAVRPFQCTIFERSFFRIRTILLLAGVSTKNIASTDGKRYASRATRPS